MAKCHMWHLHKGSWQGSWWLKNIFRLDVLLKILASLPPRWFWSFGLPIYVILLQLPQTIIINWTMTTKLFFSLQCSVEPPRECCVLNILCFVRCASMLGKRNANRCLLLSDISFLLGTQSTRKKICYWTSNRKCISAIVVTFFLCKGKDDLLCSCHLLSILCIACQSPDYWASHDLPLLLCKVSECSAVGGCLVRHYIGLLRFYYFTYFILYYILLYFISKTFKLLFI